MYIKYNNKLFELINYREKQIITTYFKNKCDETFEKTWDYYVKEFVEEDSNIQDLFDVDFVLTYIDTSETTKHGKNETRWNVNEGRPMYRSPEIEKDEIGLVLSHDSWSEDWIQDDKYSCSKIVNLYDCSEYTIIYTYTWKNGKKLEEPLVEEKRVSAEVFKEEMIKYRKSNI